MERTMALAPLALFIPPPVESWLLPVLASLIVAILY